MRLCENEASDVVIARNESGEMSVMKLRKWMLMEEIASRPHDTFFIQHRTGKQ